MSSYAVTRDGITYTVLLKRRRAGVLTFSIDDHEYTVPCDSNCRIPPSRVTVSFIAAAHSAVGTASRSTNAIPEITAPLPGIISDVKVREGDRVEQGATLLVIEAMKMENPIKASASAIVRAVHITKGQEVGHGALLLSLDLV